MRFTSPTILTVIAAAVVGCAARQTIPARAVERPARAADCHQRWVHLPVSIRFAHGASELDDGERPAIAEVGSSALARPDIRRVRVEGHACYDEADPVALSEARAATVADELLANGVPSTLIERFAFGSAQGMADGCGELGGRPANPRVEFTVLLVCP